MPTETFLHQTRLGPVAISVEDDALTGLLIAPGPRAAAVPPPPGGSLAARAATQLDEYLAGERTVFDLPLRPRGSAFEQAVWRALLAVPYGETTTYGAIAQRLGRASAARAVGRANGRNPLWVVVPCHRCVGAGGALTGYAGGLDVKRALLDLEAGALPLMA
jgi:methylated-DNA-[protein]-cysteine S-methyltransferase